MVFSVYQYLLILKMKKKNREIHVDGKIELLFIASKNIEKIQLTPD